MPIDWNVPFDSTHVYLEGCRVVLQYERQFVALHIEIPLRYVVQSNEANNRLDCDEYTLRWLTDGGLQRITQSCCETSVSTTGFYVDDFVLLQMGARCSNNSLRYDELQIVQTLV